MIGSIINDRFRIESKLGEGGAAVVYLATDLKYRTRVALKILRPFDVRGSSVFQRFKREFRACARIHHPSVIRLYHFGEISSNQFFYTMECLKGSTVADLIKQNSILSPDITLEILGQLAEAFAFYHPRGIVHRDLKPANVMITNDRHGNLRAVIMDFGLASDTTATSLTADGTILGTPMYMSPELISGLKVDKRSDFFQFGVMGYEMLTGRKPFPGKDLASVLMQIMSLEPPPPSSLIENLYEGWDVFIANCIAKEPDQRYLTANEIIADILRLEREEAVLPVRQLRNSDKSVPGAHAGQVRRRRIKKLS